VEQPPGFEDERYPDHVCKLSKALYGLKQAPRAWYECLRDFLIANAFKVGKADPTLFTKTCDGDLFVCQIYVDDIIFGSTNKKSCEEFSRVMTQKFEMSMMGELNYFLGFQVKQLKDGTFISQTKYTQDLLKRFGMKDAKPAKTPMGTDGHTDLNKGVWCSSCTNTPWTCFSLEGALKGKRWTWTMQDFHCTPMKRVTFPSSSFNSYCLFALN
jgi:hypothetical protein